jgi:valyl-tRNA synthetase
MGWPEKTSTLKAFYPTTDLVTGPDIIFFWVARMIMAGYEYMGELPFKNVYFTGIIRDKQGRKMSKSLGNSPDPLELIAKLRRGCVALRHRCAVRRSVRTSASTKRTSSSAATSATSSGTPAASARCRAAKCRARSAPRCSPATTNGFCCASTPPSRGQRGASKNTASAMPPPRSTASSGASIATGMSRRAKPFFGTDEKRKANTLAVIDFVLGHTLRLFHPFLPFITEELWHGMGFAPTCRKTKAARASCNAEPLEVDSAFQPKKGTPAALTPLGELFLPLDGLIDVEAETARVGKEIAKVESELEKVTAKLADTNFTSKVPQKVLDEHQQRKTDWEEKLAKLKSDARSAGLKRRRA